MESPQEKIRKFKEILPLEGEPIYYEELIKIEREREKLDKWWYYCSTCDYELLSCADRASFFNFHLHEDHDVELRLKPHSARKW